MRIISTSRIRFTPIAKQINNSFPCWNDTRSIPNISRSSCGEQWTWIYSSKTIHSSMCRFAAYICSYIWVCTGTIQFSGKDLWSEIHFTCISLNTVEVLYSIIPRCVLSRHVMSIWIIGIPNPQKVSDNHTFSYFYGPTIYSFSFVMKKLGSTIWWLFRCWERE